MKSENVSYFPVHFSGRVEGGACLDSNVDKGTPFRFKLGQSKYCANQILMVED